MKKILVLSLLLMTFLTSGVCAFGYNNRVPVPGSTLADKKLQRDTLMTVYLAVGTAMPRSCKKMSVIDTKVTKEPYDLEYQDAKKISGRWEEIWTVNACGEEFDAPIEFVIGKTGITYIIYPKNVQSR